MKNYKNLVDNNNKPKHIAIIMDGNGRWAKRRSLSRIEGHRTGAEAIEPVVEAAHDLGIKALSLYTFSTENWSRPKTEINGLWDTLELFFHAKKEKLKKKGVRICFSGSTNKLPKKTRDIIKSFVDETKTNKKIIVNICLNYGGRQEIVTSVNEWLKKRKPDESLTIKKMDRLLYTANLPEIDLMIRTGGEYRISNFLLWQLAYSELVFMDTLWPDFKPNHLFKAIYEFQQRHRRFGGL